MFNTLFLRRPLENAGDFIRWAKGQGFRTTVPAAQLHVTIAFSKQQLEWPATIVDRITVLSKGNRVVQPLGDAGAVVLKFSSETLEARWSGLKELGASWDFPSYQPHVTISWDAKDVDLSQVEPFEGELVFGPEIAAAIDEDWKSRLTEKAGARHTRKEYLLLRQIYDAVLELGVELPQAETEDGDILQVVKVDDELGIVFGWGIVSTIGGIPYYDLQGDYIPDASMLTAVADFSEGKRVGKEMHVGGQKGQIIFTFPLTSEVAKAMNITCPYTGWMVGYKPSSAEVLAKFKDGTYTGFSIGGSRVIDEKAA